MFKVFKGYLIPFFLCSVAFAAEREVSKVLTQLKSGFEKPDFGFKEIDKIFLQHKFVLVQTSAKHLPPNVNGERYVVYCDPKWQRDIRREVTTFKAQQQAYAEYEMRKDSGKAKLLPAEVKETYSALSEDERDDFLENWVLEQMEMRIGPEHCIDYHYKVVVNDGKESEKITSIQLAGTNKFYAKELESQVVQAHRPENFQVDGGK